MQLPEAELEITRQWLDKAEADLATAKIMMAEERSYYFIAAFHSQQAAALRPAYALSDYAVEPRYPGDLPDPGMEEAREAVALAENVRYEILRELKKK